MEKKFSATWKRSVQPRKQRKYRINAPQHVRHSMMSAHLEKSLRKETGHRAVRVVKGDEVEVMRGTYRKKKGKVDRIDTKNYKVYLENVKIKKISGQEVQVPIDPSNIQIIKLNLKDEKRKNRLSKSGDKK